ncbi:hypothetical protein E4U17_006248 [Claviceps sp. LM77 group G4]|nr:hypothetical protein E4U17_006248 [Claviceps sp. LM77 group G4]KAG6085416.1 hypothetical protein E4U16_005387 [Claviceps sp. LM84 group G4]
MQSLRQQRALWEGGDRANSMLAHSAINVQDINKWIPKLNSTLSFKFNQHLGLLGLYCEAGELEFRDDSYHLGLVISSPAFLKVVMHCLDS